MVGPGPDSIAAMRDTRSRERVYCSGPLFCPAEVAEMAGIARVLEEADYDTFLPHRDGIESLMMGAVKELPLRLFMLTPVSRWLNKAAFALDIYQVVEGCDCLVFNMNGAVPDEGGMVEAGVALGLGKPVVLYCTDPRAMASLVCNPMLYGAGNAMKTVEDFDGLPGAVAEAVGHVGRTGSMRVDVEDMHHDLLKTLKLGRTVWRFHRLLDLIKPANGMLR